MTAALIIHEIADSVGVATTDLRPQEIVRARYQHTDEGMDVVVCDAVPLGHKVALVDVAEGEQVIKYGVPIGRATRDIRPGEHVHTHNLKGERWA